MKTKFLENKQKYIDKAIDNGLVVLYYMNQEEKEKAYQMLLRDKDIRTYEIKDDKGEKIVLEYCPYNSEYKTYKELKELGDEAFNSGQYEESIRLYREILERSRKHFSYVYSRLAFAYLKFQKKEIALDYLTVASYFRKQENKTDYDDLILNIKEDVPFNERKPYIKIEEEDFKKDLIDSYSNYDINKIITLEQNGLSIDKIILELKLNKDEEIKILLVLAKKYYIMGLSFKADNYMKKVEKMRNKSKENILLYEEVKKNKKFYKYRNKV